jgi:hypothetical protein
MKLLSIFLLTMITANAHATFAPPGSQCIGDPSWPVKIIYLHGWFSASGGDDTHGFRKLEFNNRQSLVQLANKLHVRIAVPLAGAVNHKNNMREWNGASIGQVEAGAKSACNVSSLPAGKTLMGFSSGAFEVNRLVCRNRDSLGGYVKTVAIGMQKNASCSNKRLANITPHVFPPKSSASSSIQYLANLSGQPEPAGSQAVQTAKESLGANR